MSAGEIDLEVARRLPDVVRRTAPARARRDRPARRCPRGRSIPTGRPSTTMPRSTQATTTGSGPGSGSRVASVDVAAATGEGARNALARRAGRSDAWAEAEGRSIVTSTLTSVASSGRSGGPLHRLRGVDQNRGAGDAKRCTTPASGSRYVTLPPNVRFVAFRHSGGPLLLALGEGPVEQIPHFDFSPLCAGPAGRWAWIGTSWPSVVAYRVALRDRVDMNHRAFDDRLSRGAEMWCRAGRSGGPRPGPPPCAERGHRASRAGAVTFPAGACLRSPEWAGAGPAGLH